MFLFSDRLVKVLLNFCDKVVLFDYWVGLLLFVKLLKCLDLLETKLDVAINCLHHHPLVGFLDHGGEHCVIRDYLSSVSEVILNNTNNFRLFDFLAAIIMIFIQLKCVKVFIWEEIIDQLCDFGYIITLSVFKNLKNQFLSVTLNKLSKSNLLTRLTFVQSRHFTLHIWFW